MPPPSMDYMLEIPGRVIDMRSFDPKFAVLRSLLLFDGVPRRRLRDLQVRVDEVDVASGTVLIEQGQLNRHAYVVVSGALSIRIDDARVATVGPGEIVGERAALTHEPANATVVADAPTQLLVIDHRTLVGLATEVPTVLGKLRSLVGHRDAVAA